MTLIAENNENKSTGMAINFDVKEWIAEELNESSVKKFRIINNNIYLFIGEVPFTTENFESELVDGVWKLVLKGSELSFSLNDKNQIEANKNTLIALQNSTASKTFTNLAAATSFYNSQGTAPADDSEIFYLETEKEFHTWDTSETAKTRFVRKYYEQYEVKIQEAYVLTEGKTDLTDFEVGDKFRAWLGDRYVVGKIIALLTDTFANSINDNTKIKLAVDSEI